MTHRGLRQDIRRPRLQRAHSELRHEGIPAAQSDPLVTSRQKMKVNTELRGLVEGEASLTLVRTPTILHPILPLPRQSKSCGRTTISGFSLGSKEIVRWTFGGCIKGRGGTMAEPFKGGRELLAHDSE